jgi:hypothetical protein
MKSFKQMFFVIVSGVLVLAAPVIASEVPQSREVRTPTSVIDVVYVRPFTLTRGYTFTWSYDQPTIDSGVLIVVRVPPELVVPRNAAEPILYAGDRVVQRLNSGHESGHVIAIVPGSFDPSAEPIWFGQPGLPARATPEKIKSELASVKRKIRPFSIEKVSEVTRSPVEAPDLASLLRGEIAELILKYSPQESDLARKWRLPEAKAKPDPARPAVTESEGVLK